MISFRHFLEVLCRRRILKRRITFKGTHIPLFVSPDSQLRFLKPGGSAFDRELIAIAEHILLPGWNVWDIGANSGVFTLTASVAVQNGCVVGVEADIWLANWLQRSSQLGQNRSRDIRIIPAAIADQDGVEAFLIAGRGRAMNCLDSAAGQRNMGGFRTRQFAPTLRLDTLMGSVPKPDFIKIDVEGAEVQVLKGAQEVLSNCRPIIYIEVNGHSLPEVKSILSKYGYWVQDTGSPNPSQSALMNIFSVPGENSEMIEKVQRFY